MLSSELLSSIRSEFPRAGTDASGRKRIFFDAGAGSLVLRRAVEAEAEAMMNYSANLGSPSWESKRAEKIIKDGRSALGDFLNADSEDCIVAGESATSLFFRLTYALAKEAKKDENIVSTEYEHYANLSACLELERRGVVKETRLAKFDLKTGRLDLDHLASLIDSKTRIVSVSGISNALGSKTNLAAVGRLAKSVGAYFLVDAVHTAPHMCIDVERIGCDFLIFSGYKLFSRRGSFMYGRREAMKELKPYKVDSAHNGIPAKWEWGTADQALFAAISAVIEYLGWLGRTVKGGSSPTVKMKGRRRDLAAAMKWIETYEKGLSEKMLSGTDDVPGIGQIEGVSLYGQGNPTCAQERSPTFSFNLHGVNSSRLARYLWEKHSIATISSDFYSPALKTYGVETAVRASLVHYNTLGEVSVFLGALKDAAKKLR
jgi:cysteine desulfurase family protein (TIGR01976 family)